MKRNKALAVLLVAALPGSLLVGCSSGNADTNHVNHTRGQSARRDLADGGSQR